MLTNQQVVKGALITVTTQIIKLVVSTLPIKQLEASKDICAQFHHHFINR